MHSAVAKLMLLAAVLSAIAGAITPSGSGPIHVGGTTITLNPLGEILDPMWGWLSTPIFLVIAAVVLELLFRTAVVVEGKEEE
jgi:membrane protease YdiL (CAAX protease family)